MAWAISWVLPAVGMPVPMSRKLADSRVGGQVADGASEERPVRPRGEGRPGVDLEPCFHGLPVGRVVVLAAEQVIVHPGLVRHAHVEWQRTVLA
jgi:hypothetical protein